MTSSAQSMASEPLRPNCVAASCNPSSPLFCTKAIALFMQRSISMTRGATATFWTGMKLLDECADARICLSSILRVGGVHKLVAVVVHLDSAERTNHIVVSLSHAAILVSRDQSKDISSRP
jgi:hypothetical protein